MLLSKQSGGMLAGRRAQPQQLRSAAPSAQQQIGLHSRRFERTIACVQAQQHEQQQQEGAVGQQQQQQECIASTSAPLQPAAIPAASSTRSSSKAAAALYVVSKLHSKWQALGAWCKQHRLQHLLVGGDASAGFAALSVMPLLPGGGFTDLFTNRVFLAGFWAWFTAQTLKIFTKYLKKGVWDLKAIVDSGGMPSSHSALCAGITTAIAYQHGMGSSAFALAVALSSIVMYDAAGVRRHAGKQAEVLNQVIGELLEGHPVSDVKLKEVLGHTPLQVGCGAVLGVLFGIFYPSPELLVA